MKPLPGNPCKDCPNRSMDCHAKCEAYLAAREERLKEYETRKSQALAGYNSAEQLKYAHSVQRRRHYRLKHRRRS